MVLRGMNGKLYGYGGVSAVLLTSFFFLLFFSWGGMDTELEYRNTRVFMVTIILFYVSVVFFFFFHIYRIYVV